MTELPCGPAGTRVWLATRTSPTQAARILRRMIADCQTLYPWPALVDSWQADLAKLEQEVPGRPRTQGLAVAGARRYDAHKAPLGAES